MRVCVCVSFTYVQLSSLVAAVSRKAAWKITCVGGQTDAGSRGAPLLMTQAVYTVDIYTGGSIYQQLHEHHCICEELS